MKRRTYLGVCAGAGAAALSGCLGAVAGTVTRTAATPAFLLPTDDEGSGGVRRTAHLLRRLDTEIDSGNPVTGTVRVRGWITGSQLRATDYNSSRSNKPSTRDAGTGDDDGSDGDGDTRANNHNTTRSNRYNPLRGEGDGSDGTIDLPRAFEYLDPDSDGDGIADAEEGVIVGETFVVTAPVVDLPGLTDPATRAGHADYVKNMVTGARVASPTGAETVLRGLTDPTVLAAAEYDATSPLIYTSLPTDDDAPMAGSWEPSVLGGDTEATDVSEFAVGRAVATLEGDVRLPVLVYAQHLIHGGDHVFVAGWVLDEARLFANAATALIATTRTPVFGLAPGATAGGGTRVNNHNTTRSNRTELQRGGSEEEDPLVAALAAQARSALDGRPTDGDPGDDLFLFWVPMDAPLGHFQDQDGENYAVAWETATAAR